MKASSNPGAAGSRKPAALLFSFLLLALAPAPAAGQTDTVEVAINAVTGLKFDRVRFQVAPGVAVRMVVRNLDEQADMPHNLLVTAPESRLKVVQAALAVSAEEHYVPKLPEVLVATPLIGKGGEFVLRFAAPRAPGVYPYVCTFPGHGYVMYGAMYVGTEMPPLATDPNVPPGQRVAAAPPAATGAPGAESGRSARPPLPPVSYGTTLPAVSRTFMPESGPASIAVGLADGQSFNFDAGAGYLRYAWSGGFVDNADHWRGNGNAYADVLGEVFYRNRAGFPLRIGSRQGVGEVRFLGYRLVDGGIPAFRYRVDGAEVTETVRSRGEGPGLARTFEIVTREPVRLLTAGDVGVRFQSSAGNWRDGVLTLTPAQARRFTVTMIPEPEARP